MMISRTFSIQAAHRLPFVPAGHQCSRMHGHSWTVTVAIEGPVIQPQGWVYDFDEFDVAWRDIHERLDHRTLNEVVGLANPTSETLSVWIWSELVAKLPGLSRVDVSEGAGFLVSYSGETS